MYFILLIYYYFLGLKSQDVVWLIINQVIETQEHKKKTQIF